MGTVAFSHYSSLKSLQRCILSSSSPSPSPSPSLRPDPRGGLEGLVLGLAMVLVGLDLGLVMSLLMLELEPVMLPVEQEMEPAMSLVVLELELAMSLEEWDLGLDTGLVASPVALVASSGNNSCCKEWQTMSKLIN